MNVTVYIVHNPDTYGKNPHYVFKANMFTVNFVQHQEIYGKPSRPVALILDCISEINAHVRSNLCY